MCLQHVLATEKKVWLMENGSSTTADAMERSFATLTEVARTLYNGRRMNEFCKWLYASAAPYVAQGVPNRYHYS